MDWQGRWIWLKDEPVPAYNLRALARKTFALDALPARAELAISADSQYRLFVNGKWVNDGPTRAFPWKYSFDRIDVSRFLRPGRNVLAVWVQHHGEGTFHQIVTRPGLLVQLAIETVKGRKMIASDRTWKMRLDPALNEHSPQISCQMPHEEQYDAREELVGWTAPEFDDSDWPAAHVVATVGDGPWKDLTEREIGLLAVERINPVRIAAVRKVRAPNIVATLNLKRAFWPERIDSNTRNYRGAVLTTLRSPVAQRVTMYRPTTGVWPVQVYLNGKPVDLNGPQRASEVRLNKGPNTLLWVVSLEHHYDDIQLILDAPRPVSLVSPVCKGHWSVAGPFETETEDWNALKTCRTLEQLKSRNVLKYFCEPPFPALQTDDANAGMIYAKTVEGTAKTRNIENLLADNNEMAVLEASRDDVEVLIDLGKEYNAHVELDLWAPAGVVIDSQIFEERHTPALGNRSGFRYITRDGWQKFTTFRHYGGRYLALAFRNLTGPVRIRKVVALFVHNPVEHKGKFRCSDHLLNGIWDIGKQTLLCCMEDTFTDCPTYEQTYWVGDGRNEALICHTTFGEYNITRRCARLPAFSLHRSDLTESQVPSSWQNLLPAWSFLWVQMIWEHYYFSGDESLLKEMYPFVTKMLGTIRKKYLDEKTGLFAITAWNMFDWTKVDDQHRLVTHNNMFLIGALRQTAEMARTLGRASEAKGWQRWTDQLIERINRHLWSQERQAYIDSIHDDGVPSTVVSRPTNTLAVLYDVAPPARLKKILPMVLGEQHRDVVPFGSPFALFYLLECLVKLNRFDQVAALVRDEWGYMVDQGATTFWETLRKTRSHCHAWSAAPTYFLSRYVLGVEPARPGFQTVLFAPRILDLTYAAGTVPTPSGNVHVRWDRTGREFTMTIRKPAPLAGRLQLPAELKVATLTINGRAVGKPKAGQTINLPGTETIRVEAKLNV